MKMLAMTFVVFFMFGVLPPRGSQQQKPADSKSDVSAPLQQPSPVTIVNNQNCPAPQQDSAPEKAHQYPEKSFWGDAPSWALVIVGIVAAWIALGTLSDIKKQTEIARQAADAAKDGAKSALLNAQAVIHAERPWLFIPMGEEYSEIQDPILIAKLPGEIRRSYCTFTMKNFGSSPAKVVETKLRLVTSTNFDFVPDVHIFDAQDSIEDDYNFPHGTTAKVQATFMPDGFITAQEKEEIEVKKTRYLWLCGYLKYKDTFDRPDAPTYETRLCYKWVNYMNSPKPFWSLAGPIGHNKAS
jgi:hypothetical protein